MYSLNYQVDVIYL